MSALHIGLQEGDITTARGDAIVNAANPAMLGGEGVDGAIHRAAGEELLALCRQLPAVDGVRCPIGEARITSAGKLNTRYVIHTVGPRYYIDRQPERLLASAYRSSLQLAQDHQCRSVAFPAISCGVYGYPPEEAASIALSVCNEPAWQAMQITFYLFGAGMFETWQRVFTTLADNGKTSAITR